MKNLSDKSDWNADQIAEFLTQVCIPIRIAVMDGDYPLICSVWYEYDNDELLLVSHKDSKLSRLLTAQRRCGFEIAPNDPPYHGVRGKADVVIREEGVEVVLKRLIERYLGDSNQSLAEWLLSRVEDEVVYCLRPGWVTAWDYGSRMEKA